MIKLNLNYAIDKNLLKNYQSQIKELHSKIETKTGKGHEYLGWLDLPERYNTEEYQAMKAKAKSLQGKIDYLLILGLGGSYISSRCADELLNGLYSKSKVKLVYSGYSLSSTYNKQLLEFLKDKRFGICMNSKSGSTIESAVIFRLFEDLLIKQVGEAKAKELIVVNTDAKNGKLHDLALAKGYTRFVMPDDIMGYYPMLTPVGIFPMLVVGIDTDAIFAGAKKAMLDLRKSSNSAYDYALARYILHTQKKYQVELFVSYELQMQYFGKWWQELFGESEGKEHKSLLPLTSFFSTDLHSLGQYIQEGTKNILFETIIKINKPQVDVKMFKETNDLDRLNYLEHKTLNEINYIAQKGVLEAHHNVGKIPNIVIEMDEMNAENFGYAVFWFFKACTMSTYLLGLNPYGFDKPGVKGVHIYKGIVKDLLK